MLEIKGNTINGYTQEKGYYILNQPTIPFTIKNPDAGSSDISYSLDMTIPIVRTMSKPSYVFCYVSPDYEWDTINNETGYVINSFDGSTLLQVTHSPYGQRMIGYAFGGLSTTADSTFSIQHYAGESITDCNGTIKAEIAFNDYVMFDYNTQPSNVTFKYNAPSTYQPISVACADPTTDFASYGTEFDSTQYTNSSDWTTGTVALNSQNIDFIANTVTLIGKFENINLSGSKIMALIANATCTSNVHNTNSSVNLFARLWNFNTSSWDSISTFCSGSYVDADMTGFATTGGPFGAALLTQSGDETWSSGSIGDYIQDGVCYYGFDITPTPSNSETRTHGILLNYLGLMFINGNVWD